MNRFVHMCQNFEQGTFSDWQPMRLPADVGHTFPIPWKGYNTSCSFHYPLKAIWDILGEIDVKTVTVVNARNHLRMDFCGL